MGEDRSALPDAVQIRAATAGDLNGMVELLGHLFAQEAEFKPSADAQRTGLAAILASRSVGLLLVAETGDRLQGMVNLLFTQSTALGGRVAILEDMIVLPAMRASGLGRRLIEAAIDACRGEGCLRITLLTDADNGPAHRFYERAGFARSEMVAYRMLLSD